MVTPNSVARLGRSWPGKIAATPIIQNGEVVVITDQGLESHRPFPLRPARPCIFEYIYFARPDSIVGGQTVYDIRKRMGVELAREAPIGADVIVPIPDSGVPAAIGV